MEQIQQLTIKTPKDDFSKLYKAEFLREEGRLIFYI